MFAHICLGTNDPVKAKTFYDAIFAVVDGEAGSIFKDGQRVMYSHAGSLLVLGKPLDGNPATPSNGATVGFSMSSAAQVDAWHAAGIENGGSSCEDPPGIREASGFYLAYLRDPDANKLCAVFRPEV